MTRVRDLRQEDLDALPSPCRGCMFWQSSRAGRGGLGGDPKDQDAWWRGIELDWGVPGKAVWDDGALVAYAMFAPADHFDRSRSVGPHPSDDAIVLATVWVAPGRRGGGVARHLLQATVREAIAHGAVAVEAYGVTTAMTSDTPEEAGGCVVSSAALEALGFKLHRADLEHPLYRLDVERTARWPEAVGHALGEVIATLSGRERARSPRPALETLQP